MERPFIEHSATINQLSFQIEQLERGLYRYHSLIELFDSSMRETIGLAIEVATCQLEVIEAFFANPPSIDRQVSWIQNNLNEKIEGVRADYIANYSVTLLLEHKSPVGAKGEYGRTPLHLSTFHGKIETARILIKAGAPVNAQTNPDDFRKTPLYNAVVKGGRAMVALLVECPDLDVSLPSGSPEFAITPLNEALERGELSIAMLLFKHPSFDESRFTPSEKVNPEVVQNLLNQSKQEKNASPS